MGTDTLKERPDPETGWPARLALDHLGRQAPSARGHIMAAAAPVAGGS